MKNSAFVLIQTLIFTLIALIMLLGISLVMYYGSRFSGIEKRYATALEAAKGGVFKCIKEIKEDCISGNCPPPASDISNNFCEDIKNNYYKKYSIGDYEIYCKVIDQMRTDKIFYHLEIIAQKPGIKECGWIAVGYILK